MTNEIPATSHEQPDHQKQDPLIAQCPSRSTHESRRFRARQARGRATERAFLYSDTDTAEEETISGE